MTCPMCSKQLLFGSSDCSCGWSHAVRAVDSVDLSYREALPVFWRIWWTSAVFTLIAMYASTRLALAVMGAQRVVVLFGQPLFQWLIQNLWSALAIFLFVPWLVLWPYERFKLVISTAGGETQRFSLNQRFRVTAFIVLRSMAAGLLGQVLVIPVAILFGMMRISVGPALAVAVSILLTGPLIVRFLIGHPFGSFSIEVRRSTQS